MKNYAEILNKINVSNVEYIKLGELIDYEQPTKYIVSSTEYDDSYTTPVLTAGQSFILGYTNEVNNHFIANTDNPVIIFDDFTGAYKWVDFEFKVKSSAMKMLRPKSNCVSLRYIFYCMEKLAFRSTEHKRLWIGTYSEFLIPVPSIQVQNDIVDLLDNFLEYSSELEHELELRKKQFSEVAFRLLIDENQGEKKKILDICSVTKGASAIQKTIPGQYPMVVTTSERKSSNNFQFDTKAVCIPLVSSRGHGVASLNHVYYQEGKFALGNILCAVVPKDEDKVLAQYLYYYFECTKDKTLVPLMKGGANVAMKVKDVESVKVIIPDISDQNRIIEKLKAFEEYCSVILPREIELRKKQYNYYRDIILSF